MAKVKRKIIKVDEEKCDGCGLCIPGCPEAALQIVDGKAKLVKDLYCDGLGACLGHCPKDALHIEEREAESYDDDATIKRIKKVAPNMLESHMEHMREHGMGASEKPKQGHKHPFDAKSGCPSARAMSWDKETDVDDGEGIKLKSQLRQWPVQLMLVPPTAPYLQGADLLIAADCTPFSYANFHRDFLKGKAVIVGCPKLDDVAFYAEKITEIIKQAKPKSITVVRMEVPCCYGIVHATQEAIKASGTGGNIPFKEEVISIKGEKLDK